MTILTVSGLPPSFTPEQVRHLFEPFGPVRAVRSSSDGDGIACYDVEMAESEDAEAARRLLEGLIFGDRPLHLTYADGVYSAVA